MPKNCPKCELENSDSAKFCKGCGFDFRTVVAAEKPLDTTSLICGKCQSSHSPGAKFCKSCGASTVVGSPVLAATPTPDVLSEPVPAPVPAPVPVPVPVGPPVVLPVQSPVTPQPPVTSPSMTKAVSLPVSKSSTALAPRQKKSLPPLVMGGLAMACVGLIGGSYWLMTAGTRESSAASTPAVTTAPAIASTPIPKATATEAELVPASVPVPVPAASSTLPVPALIAAPTQTPEAPRASQATTPAPVSIVKVEPAPEPSPVVRNNSELEAKPVLKREQRTADEVALAQKTNRQAIARQKERDKATLSRTNKTLDDLLK